jgi:ketosteroid isomerase-like protein
VSQANIAFVQNMYAAFGRGDVPTMLSGMTADIDWHCNGRPADYPTFGKRKGPQEVGEFFKTVAEIGDFSEFTAREFYAAGDHVFVLGHYELTLKKNGRHIASDFCHVFAFRDGKVAMLREFLDTAAAAEAFRA